MRPDPSPGEEREGDGGRCRRKAQDLLARRPHFRAELAGKLTRRGFGEELVEATCGWLEERRYLDDRRAARELAAGALARRGYGPRRMRAELARRGVAAEVVDEVLAEAWREGEKEAALAVARRRARLRGFDRRQLGRHLEAKGYGAAAIRDALDRVGDES